VQGRRSRRGQSTYLREQLTVRRPGCRPKWTTVAIQRTGGADKGGARGSALIRQKRVVRLENEWRGDQRTPPDNRALLVSRGSSSIVAGWNNTTSCMQQGGPGSGRALRLFLCSNDTKKKFTGGSAAADSLPTSTLRRQTRQESSQRTTTPSAEHRGRGPVGPHPPSGGDP
jgi:hypothetical protein